MWLMSEVNSSSSVNFYPLFRSSNSFFLSAYFSSSLFCFTCIIFNRDWVCSSMPSSFSMTPFHSFPLLCCWNRYLFSSIIFSYSSISLLTLLSFWLSSLFILSSSPNYLSYFFSSISSVSQSVVTCMFILIGTCISFFSFPFLLLILWKMCLMLWGF